MNIRVFTDIDDTLMATGRKVPVYDRKALGAKGKDGLPLSYCDPAHMALISALTSLSTEPMVAVTARSADGLRRVELTVNAQAVVDFGATVLDENGQPDPAWYAILAARQDRELEAEIERFSRELMRKYKELLPEWRRTPASLAFVNFRLKQDEHLNLLTDVRNQLDYAGITRKVLLHVTDHDVALLPKYINKGDAVRYLITKNGWDTDVLIGCGDSMSDLSFMQSMNLAVLPGNSRALTTLATLAKSQGAI